MPVGSNRGPATAAVDINSIQSRSGFRRRSHALVLVGDVAEFGRQRVDDMEILDRQQLGLALGEPPARGSALALGAMPVAAI